MKGKRSEPVDLRASGGEKIRITFDRFLADAKLSVRTKRDFDAIIQHDSGYRVCIGRQQVEPLPDAWTDFRLIQATACSC